MFFSSCANNVLQVICVQLFCTLFTILLLLCFLGIFFLAVHCFNLFVDGYHWACSWKVCQLLFVSLLRVGQLGWLPKLKLFLFFFLCMCVCVWVSRTMWNHPCSAVVLYLTYKMPHMTYSVSFYLWAGKKMSTAIYNLLVVKLDAKSKNLWVLESSSFVVFCFCSYTLFLFEFSQWL